jgi:hypothetical protein
MMMKRRRGRLMVTRKTKERSLGWLQAHIMCTHQHTQSHSLAHTC